MAFKFVVLAAFVAVASAGGPAAYDIAASSGDHSSVGFSQESTQKGYGGQNVVSSYSKSDDSAHSYVRVSSQSISNDALLNYDVNHAPLVKTAYSAPAYIAPSATPLIAKNYAAPYSYGSSLLASSYSAPLLTKTYAASAPLIQKAAIAAPAPLLAKTYAAPVAAAPLYAKSYSAPLLHAAPAASYLHAAPAASYLHAAPAASYLHASPAASYLSAAPAASYLSAAPAASLLARSYEYAAHAPVITKSALLAPAQGYTASIASAPLLTKTYAAAPQAQLISKAYGYEAAAPVVHTVFNGLGTSYSW
ncbi:unnamed protein product [Xylocopa violacea]|uniref:Uncharacterized protein n=1 Tax=Xylocopa violacea TaxID=135666 RepID=A0ABP1NDV4_XYLVO